MNYTHSLTHSELQSCSAVAALRPPAGKVHTCCCMQHVTLPYLVLMSINLSHAENTQKCSSVKAAGQ